jgi:hypothetical protein
MLRTNLASEELKGIWTTVRGTIAQDYEWLSIGTHLDVLGRGLINAQPQAD